MSSELESLKQRITELETNNAKLEAEKAEIEIKNAELLKQVIKKDAKHDAENVKLGATIEKLKYENAELKDRITKVKQNQLQNDSAKGTQDKRNITPNNNLSNFNLGAVHHEKLLKEKEMDNFLLEVHKIIVSNEINHRKKDVENIVQMIADGIKKDTQLNSLLSLAQLFDKADDAKYGAIQHLFMLQKQRSEETGLRLPEISRKNLQRKTQKALTNDKVQDIIDNFSEHYDNDNTDVSSHMTEILAGGPGQNSVEVSELIAPIPVTHGSNSLGNSSFTLQITPSEAENNVDYDDVYFNDSMPSSIEKETNKVKINDDKDTKEKAHQ
ncbi:hypothetical protein GLOIN_2v1762090 [Rhizophagus irregularis DAOM 181602=DAOM 197198]|nr:hypothetical protein GLOIN_2v1762090 [Rhizophagus irregularis DAOM 181602=DAOM 197198]